MTDYKADCASDGEGTICLVKNGNIQVGYLSREGISPDTLWIAFLTMPRGATGGEIQRSVNVGRYHTKKLALEAIEEIDSSSKGTDQ